MEFPRHKLYQRIAATIADAIEAGRYQPGARLPGERDLAEEYKVSRPTIREAMIALEMRGLIEVRHGSGLYVTRRNAPLRDVRELDTDVGAFELTEARIIVEGEAVALAAMSMDDAKLAELESILRDMAAEEPSEPGVMDADRRFHLAIASATENEALRMLVELLWDLRTRSPLCVTMFERAKRSGVTPRIDEHRPILEALRNRDPAGARAAMRSHLRGVIDDLLAATEHEVMARARSEIDERRSTVARRIEI
ncbi:FadR family transcriptional regulator [Sphingomonas gilva]|uniref:FadR family transcriptional regulator n=1 Tax=Sphingomonas gilva TaxID=2305907 RepID=A0A396RSQ4_9SPHN|nr:FadR/GntR family transcriptional regulator [Sphingomonas gilva]RHW19106.1 FadR family transcriptional regulator [Sphingomonas gilva]